MTSGTRGAARERFTAATKAIAVEREALAAKARAMARSDARAAAGAAARDRRDAAEGRGRHRGGALLGAGYPVSSSAATTRRAISACAGAASAGACRRRSASSLPCPIGRCSALIGDGSAMYTCQGLWTAARYRIGAVFVILNNSSYRILKQRLHAMRGLAEQADSYVGMELVDPKIDFVVACAFARRHGGTCQDRSRGHRSDCAGIQNGEPMLIDVELDRAFKPM